LSIENATTLTLGADMVVRGKTGSIGDAHLFGGHGKLINQGLISIDVPGGTLDITPSPFSNTGTIGTIKANGAGSTVNVRSNPFTNTGTITELNGGKVLINP
jgi:hypothetical protein